MMRNVLSCDESNAVDLRLRSYLVSNLDGVRALSAELEARGQRSAAAVPVVTVDDREGLSPGSVARMLADIRTFEPLESDGFVATFGCRGGQHLGPDAVETEVIRTVEDCRRHAPEAQILLGGSCILNCSASTLRRLGGKRWRVGEAIALGADGLGNSLGPLRDDVFVISAEVIQVLSSGVGHEAPGSRALVAVGDQDVDSRWLRPVEPHLRVQFATSDHLMIKVGLGDRRPRVGERMAFRPGYQTLLRAFISPYVTKKICDRRGQHDDN